MARFARHRNPDVASEYVETMKTPLPRSAESKTPFPVPGHDHHPCLAEALAKAADAFAARKLRLTPLRERVFAEIAGSHHAVGAYDVLERLAQSGERLAPISVYRAIDALIAAGVIHRLESRNAFFACHATHGGGRELLVLVCEACGGVAEVSASPVFTGIETAARSAGFTPRTPMVEVSGRCANCGEAAAP